MVRAGFTLFELLVALAILSVLLVVVPLNRPAGLAGMETRAAARELAAALRAARGAAVAGNREVAFRVDVEARRFGVSGERALGPDFDLILHAAAEERVDDTTAAIRFFPDGTSTGGGVTVRRGGTAVIVAVDWLTGQVSLAEP